MEGSIFAKERLLDKYNVGVNDVVVLPDVRDDNKFMIGFPPSKVNPKPYLFSDVSSIGLNFIVYLSLLFSFSK